MAALKSYALVVFCLLALPTPSLLAQSRLAQSYRATPASASRAATTGDAFTADLVQSTVRLKVDDPDGHSYGTGTIIDSRAGEALVLTCGHLFRDSGGKGTITVDVVVDGIARSAPGQLISYDETRDLGFVSIRPGGAVRAAKVAAQPDLAQVGDPVWSVGCNGGTAPSVEATRVTKIDRYAGPPNIEISGAPVEGRSGGGLFNERGEVIGVCFAADGEYDEGLYAAVESIHAELDRLQLTDVYRAPSPSGGAIAQAGPPAMPASLPAPSQNAGPIPASNSAWSSDLGPSAASSVQPTAATSPDGGLTSEEQMVLAELSARSAGGQVICIVQPGAPGAKNEIYVLNNASATLLEQLAALQQPDASSARLTSLEVPETRPRSASGGSPAVPQNVLHPQQASGWGAGR